MPIHFIALETETASKLRAGGLDANGQKPERHTATSDGLPCRHCLGMIKSGEDYLVLAHRPFPAPQPYAEVGPIFLHAADCERGGGSAAIPAFLDSPRYIVRGYGADHRIVYGSGAVTETSEIPARAEQLMGNPQIKYVHVRSASNNCFHCRIDPA